MNTQPDFEELLKLFEENSVAYMVVGGYAVTFNEIVSRVERGRYGDTEVSFIGKEDLIQNKKASNRTQDAADVEKLTS